MVGRCCGRPMSRGRSVPPTTPPRNAPSICAGRPMSAAPANPVSRVWPHPARAAAADLQDLQGRTRPVRPGRPAAGAVVPFTDHGGLDASWDLAMAMVSKWRRAAEVDAERVLVDQPEPPVMESGDFLPEPRVLHPSRSSSIRGSTCSRMSCNSGLASGRGTPGSTATATTALRSRLAGRSVAGRGQLVLGGGDGHWSAPTGSQWSYC